MAVEIVKSALCSTHWRQALKLKMTAATLARTAPVEAAAPAAPVDTCDTIGQTSTSDNIIGHCAFAGKMQHEAEQSLVKVPR